jgi:hypothetical protein
MFGLALVGASADVRALARIDGVSSSAVDVHAAAGPFRLEAATPSSFREHLNTPFEVRSSNGATGRLVLVEVAERPVTRNVAQFSLILHAPQGESVPDGTLAFRHPAFGEFELFITRIGPTLTKRGCAAYQACFSRHQHARADGSSADHLDGRFSWRS